jgi:serine protease
MTSNGGPVQASPAVYIVYWGWNGNDPSGQAAYQEAFFSGVGGSAWNASQTQYCGSATNLVSTGIESSEFPHGVKAGSSCPSGATFVGNPTGMLKGTWSDDTNAVPTSPSDADVQAEAVRAAAFFGNTTAASNESAQYVIDTPTGNSSAGFGTSWCAYHDAARATAYGNVYYTNFPYITDAGSICGENAVNSGSAGLLDGVSIAGGHEFAETETDPLPSSGWADIQAQETGDKCAWVKTGSGRMHDITLSTGTFAVQTLWSNAANAGAGGCVG